MSPAIHWAAPWLAHLCACWDDWFDATPASDATQWPNDSGLNTLNRRIAHRRSQGVLMHTGLGLPLHLIAQADLPTGVAYETHIAHTGGVPSRPNAHDWFNACVWLLFPHTKAVLNARQSAHIAQQNAQQPRGMTRDVVTLFDENAAVLVVSDTEHGRDIAAALRAFDWRGALVAPRTLWDNPHQPTPNAHAALYVFGHALMEKLATPRKSICAHTWVVRVAPDWFARSVPERIHALDVQLAQQLRTHAFHTLDFCPLPILGVPHFCADNTDETFYNDARVFRSGRMRAMHTPNTPAHTD